MCKKGPGLKLTCKKGPGLKLTCKKIPGPKLTCKKNTRSQINKGGKMLSEVIEYFPKSIQNIICLYIEKNKSKENLIEEIRLRSNGNLTIKIGQELINLSSSISKEDMQETFENVCEKSIYSYTKQISEGFITIKGGNRVGITGSAVIDKDKIINLNYVSSLNFRIAKQIKDVSNPILKYVINIENNTIYNTIIASPPGAGKTTILRDLVRKISDRNARNKLFA